MATVTHFEPALPPTQSPWEAARRGPGEAQERLRTGPGSPGEAQQKLEKLRRRPKKPETRTSADPESSGGPRKGSLGEAQQKLERLSRRPARKPAEAFGKPAES